MHLVRALVSRLENMRRPCLLVFLAGLLTSGLYSLVVYKCGLHPRDCILDPDFHGMLGISLYKNHTFAFFPDTEPTIKRMPGYPLFLALTMALSGGWFPYCAHVAQCFVFGLTCVVVYWTARAMWDARTAIIATLLVAVHPAAIWWTNRLYIETLATLTFTSMIAAAYAVSVRPDSKRRWVVLGIVIGMGALIKSTFLPYVVLTPLLMLLLLPRKPRIVNILLLFMMTALILSPWIYRNWRLTGRFIPGQVLAGVDCLIGDTMVDHYNVAPLSMLSMLDAGADDRKKIYTQVPKGLRGAKQELALEEVAIRAVLDRYRREPAFVLRKYAADALWFWTQCETPTKTIVFSALMLPLLLAFLVSVGMMRRRGQIRSIHGVHVWMVLLYYLMHIPVYAEGRYSVILLPTMLMYISAYILSPALSEKKSQ